MLFIDVRKIKNPQIREICGFLVVDESTLSGQQDSNLRPPAPKAGTLAGLRHAPIIFKISYCTYTDERTLANSRYIHIDRWRREGDSNPRYGFPHACLANMWFQPLTHLSLCLMFIEPHRTSTKQHKDGISEIFILTYKYATLFATLRRIL